jgi:hypothetical protein
MNEIISDLGWLATFGVMALGGWGLRNLVKRPRKPPPPGSRPCGYCGGSGIDRVKLTNSCRFCGGRGWVRG